jgi:N-acetylneuraminic acid mutarotase
MKRIFILLIAIALFAFASQAQDTWTQKADFGGTARYGAFAFSINGKGYLGTGDNNNVLYKDVWEFDPLTHSWTQKADFATVCIGAASFTSGAGNIETQSLPALLNR